MVPERGIEPPHLAVHDFESCASTNSATPARVTIVYDIEKVLQESKKPTLRGRLQWFERWKTLSAQLTG